MRKIEQKDIQPLLLSIMCKIDKLCRENNLKYQLFAGTLIGAIRHKGFIPWDDDIDIVMPREDYEKIGDIINNSNLGIKYISYEKNNEYMYAFAKVYDTSTRIEVKHYREIKDLGLYVDIFPIDEQGSDLRKAKALVKKMRWLNSFLYESDLIKYTRTAKKWYMEPVKFMTYPVAKFFGTKYWIEKMNALAKKYNGTNSIYHGINVDPCYHVVLKKEYFDNSLEWDFEGHRFFIPCGYDEILRTNYGDYMQLPPVEKRHSDHNMEAYFIETTDESDGTSKVEKD